MISAPGDAPSFDIAGEEHLLQNIVDNSLALGVWITVETWLVCPCRSHLCVGLELCKKASDALEQLCDNVFTPMTFAGKNTYIYKDA